MPSPQPQKIANPGRYDQEDGTLDEFTHLRLWVDNSKENLCFRFVVWGITGPSEPDDATRTFIYETNVFEIGESYSCTTTTVYSTRGYLGCHRPHMALSEKYLVELRVTGFESNNTKRWTLVLTEYNPNDQGQVVAIVSLRKGDNTPVKRLFFTTSDMVVVIGPAFLSLYTIQDLKAQHKQWALPRQHIQMDWDDISRPFYDRGFDWMIIHCDLEFRVIRLPQDSSSPPCIAALGRNPVDTSRSWIFNIVRKDAAFSFYHDWTAKLITYTWDVEMTHCLFQIKHVWIPALYCLSGNLRTIGSEMTSGRLVLADDDCNCIILDTVPPVGPTGNSNGSL